MNDQTNAGSEAGETPEPLPDGVARAMLERVDAAAVFYDASRRPRWYNARAAEFAALAGLDLATGRTRHVYLADRETRLTGNVDILDETLAGPGRGQLYWLGDPCGTQVAVVSRAHRLETQGGGFLGWSILAYDVTETATIFVNRAEYFSAISHELRTPLTSILGYLDLIIDDGGSGDDEIDRQLRIVLRRAEQLSKLVADYAELSGVGTVRAQETDLCALVTDTVRARQERAAGRERPILTRVPDRPLVCRVDPGRIAKALDNILANAVTYTPPEGSIRVSVEADSTEVRIAVADEGAGIDAAEMPRIFDLFYRSPKHYRKVIQGNGIGLPIAHTIVTAHHGRITVHSVPGRGATFTIHLPCGAVR
ncbi:MAG TPA: HAMP domain-containing sensor histidine kinase [Microbacteriaceae bacterium]|nr:HAMP domain-containing sensor histidine kinase [Microbacteriaceae bacterium]